MLNHLISLLICGPVLLTGLVVHEVAHAVTADHLGDPTPRLAGRISFDPRRHLDPLGLIVLVITWLNGVPFGWAKPVLVDPYRFRSPVRDMAVVAAAGPVSNLIQAAVWLLLLTGVTRFLTVTTPLFAILVLLTKMGVLFNMVLAFFNLLPIPPLDGSRILNAFLSPANRMRMARIYPYGILILFGLLYFGLLDPGFDLVIRVSDRLTSMAAGV